MAGGFAGGVGLAGAGLVGGAVRPPPKLLPCLAGAGSSGFSTLVGAGIVPLEISGPGPVAVGAGAVVVVVVVVIGAF